MRDGDADVVYTTKPDHLNPTTSGFEVTALSCLWLVDEAVQRQARPQLHHAMQYDHPTLKGLRSAVSGGERNTRYLPEVNVFCTSICKTFQKMFLRVDASNA